MINEEKAVDGEYQVTKAAQQAGKPKPDKNAIVANLYIAKEVVQNVAGAVRLIAAFVDTIDKVKI